MSAEQRAMAAAMYPGDWWTHHDGDRRPVPVVVGNQRDLRRGDRPRASTDEDPVWHSPDGYGLVQVLHEHSYDCWYRHQATGTLVRMHDKRPYRSR